MKKINELMNQGRDAVQSKMNKLTVITWSTLATLFGMTEAEAQQAFSTMTVSPDGTTLTTKSRDIANGTNINTVDGPKFFNNYNTGGTILIYDENTGKRYEPNNNNFARGTTTQQTNETIGNGTASYNSPLTNINYNNFVDQNNNNTTLPLTLINKRDTGTMNGNPTTSPIEILRQEYILNNINSLPDNTRIFISSRPGFVSPGGINRNGINDGIKKVNGAWTEPAFGPDGTTPLNNQGPTLGLDNPTNPFSNAVVFPSYADDIIQFTDGLPGDTDYKVQLINNGGQLVKNIDKAHENAPISVSDLSSGMHYVVAIDPKTGNRFIKKIIKK